MALDHDEVVNWCGGQTKASCATHQQYFLIREGVNSQALCCERRCPTPVRWRCPEGFSSDYQCSVGLCFRHMKALQSGEHVTRVQPRGPEDIPPGHPAPAQQQEEPAVGDHDVGDPLPDLIEHDHEHEDDDVPVLYTPLPDVVADDFVPLQTDGGHQPTYMGPSHESLSVHLLLNTHLCVLVRRAFTRGPGVQTLHFLQHICAITPPTPPFRFCTPRLPCFQASSGVRRETPCAELFLPQCIAKCSTGDWRADWHQSRTTYWFACRMTVC